MPQDPFPDPGPPDDAEPDGFPSAEDGPGLGQGLYVTLPAEQLTLSGFCQGGASDTMAPGPLLATVVHTVTGEDGSGLAGCSDDQLIGIISAARRMESRSAWTLMAAVGEFARRAGTGVESEFAADELASELRMSQQSAAGQMDFATRSPGGCRRPSPRWPPGRSTRSTCGSSRTRPASCPTRTRPRPTPSSPTPRRA